MTSAGDALLAALADTYHHSWRLVVLNTALSAVLVPLVVAALWAPLALVPTLMLAGPLLAALMHCAVTLARTEDLRLRDGLDGLRLHWRRGLVLGLAAAFVIAAGAVAVYTYGRAGTWVLAAIVLYLLVAFAAYQLALWPLAVSGRATPLRTVAASAGRTAFRRPLQAVVLALALAAINLAGAAAALMPLLTLTVAYSFVAAAHFALPESHRREGGH
jgi:hypothetical protein